MKLKLLRFGEGGGGRMDIHMVAAGVQPHKEMLDSSATYVLDCSWCVFVWVSIKYIKLSSMLYRYNRQGHTLQVRKKAGLS